MFLKNTHILGKEGEDIACNFLKNKGYKIIEKNFRSKFGEIDIIAKDGNTLVFIEVKSKEGIKFGSPQEAVNRKKLEKIKKCINYFLHIKHLENSSIRLEVVAIQTDNYQVKKIELINAFE